MFSVDVTKVQPLAPRRLQLEFSDGLQGVVDLDRVIQQYTGVFAPLLDDDYFRRVSLNRELGTIVWPNGADLCPDVLYSFVSGRPVLVSGQQVLN